MPIPPGEFVLGETTVCDPIGEPAPLSFKVELWERDDFGFEFDPSPTPPQADMGVETSFYTEILTVFLEAPKSTCPRSIWKQGYPTSAMSMMKQSGYPLAGRECAG